VVARAQLLELGFGPGAIRRRIRSQRLHRVYHEVYAVGHPSLSTHGRWLAAVLAAGPQAVLSHRSAAALWGLRSTAAPTIDVTVIAHARRNRGNLALHVTRQLPRQDRAARDGIPVTSVARTLLDIAEVIPGDQLAAAVEKAERMRWLDRWAIDEVCARGNGRRGLGALRAAVEAAVEPQPFTRSELERAFYGLCRNHHLPLPLLNQWVLGYEVDALWPGPRLVVEVDGYETHRTRAAFERDRARDGALQVAGYRVLRFTWRMIEREPESVAATIRSVLAAGAG
jgi:very-short-patch-repair endonuclease